jgi:hypothetical protein
VRRHRVTVPGGGGAPAPGAGRARPPPPPPHAVWDLLQSQLPGYRSYERESGRVVRLFRLRPLTRTTIP